MGAADSSQGPGPWLQCSGGDWDVECETRTLRAMLAAAAARSWTSKSFRNQQCGAILPSLALTAEDYRGYESKQRARPGTGGFTLIAVPNVMMVQGFHAKVLQLGL